MRVDGNQWWKRHDLWRHRITVRLKLFSLAITVWHWGNVASLWVSAATLVQWGYYHLLHRVVIRITQGNIKKMDKIIWTLNKYKLITLENYITIDFTHLKPKYSGNSNNQVFLSNTNWCSGSWPQGIHDSEMALKDLAAYKNWFQLSFSTNPTRKCCLNRFADTVLTWKEMDIHGLATLVIYIYSIFSISYHVFTSYRIISVSEDFLYNSLIFIFLISLY